MRVRRFRHSRDEVRLGLGLDVLLCLVRVRRGGEGPRFRRDS